MFYQVILALIEPIAGADTALQGPEEQQLFELSSGANFANIGDNLKDFDIVSFKSEDSSDIESLVS